MKQTVAIAGATGYTGQELLAQLKDHGTWRALALVRPGSERKLPTGQEHVACAQDDVPALTEALRGSTAVIQTIGTTRAQFGPGVSYETVDYATTVALVAAAQAAGVKRFLLLSSVGAGRPMGAYLEWKARTEEAVTVSDLDWTILRPAAIVGPGRRLMQAGSAPFALLSVLPLVGALAMSMRPITVTQLARTFIRCLDLDATKGQILEGTRLWRYV